MRKSTGKPTNLAKSAIIAEVPKACSDETAAVEFLEKRRWNGEATCPHCASKAVYQMKDVHGDRNKRFLWKCRECRKQFTVRVGTIFEDSKAPLRKWCYAFWAASSAKNGIAALELSRQIEVTYKTALFMMNRIRYAMAPANAARPKLGGHYEIVEADETYVGGKPKPGESLPGFGTSKTPVFAVVQRGGDVRTKIIANITAASLGRALTEQVDTPRTRLFTDDLAAYKRPGKTFVTHQTVNHSAKEYARGEVHTNTIEGFFSLLKRGLTGTYRAVSKQHLHRYLAEFEFRCNARTMNDGERLDLLVKATQAKRLIYREPVKQKAKPAVMHPIGSTGGFPVF